MGIFETTAEFMTSREGGQRVWRTGWFGRRRYVIRDQADKRALVSYARATGLMTMAFVLIYPTIHALLEDRRLAYSLGFLLVILLSILVWVLHLRLTHKLGTPTTN